MRIRNSLLSVMFFLLLGCSQEEGRMYVSLIKLIISPEEYVGKEIMVQGYLYSIDEPYLFLSKEDALIGNVGSAIRIHDRSSELEKIECTNSYVTIIGEFKQLEYLPIPVIANFSKVSKYSFPDEDTVKRVDCWPPE